MAKGNRLAGLKEKARELENFDLTIQLKEGTEKLLKSVRREIKKTTTLKIKQELIALEKKLEERRKAVRRRLGLAIYDDRSLRILKKGKKARY